MYLLPQTEINYLLRTQGYVVKTTILGVAFEENDLYLTIIDLYFET